MRGLGGKALTALCCLVGRHVALSTIQDMGDVQHVGCRDCGREFAQYHGARTLVLWDHSTENEFLLDRGYDATPAREAWALGQYRAASTGVALVVDLAAQKRRLAAMDFSLQHCERTAAKALGYPLFSDDQANFPGCTPGDGYAVGEHTPDSLVEELAAALEEERRLRTDLGAALGESTDRLREANRLISELKRERGE